MAERIRRVQLQREFRFAQRQIEFALPQQRARQFAVGPSIVGVQIQHVAQHRFRRNRVFVRAAIPC